MAFSVHYGTQSSHLTNRLVLLRLIIKKGHRLCDTRQLNMPFDPLPMTPWPIDRFSTAFHRLPKHVFYNLHP